MAGFQIKVTPEGRAALVNAQNTGTLPVVVTEIGITATVFDPTTPPPALPGELKRLTTFGGASVADDTIHVTIRDDSADSYSLHGFALYLDDGTLFALYGQQAPILEKSVQSTLQLAVDVVFVDIAADSITFGNTDFQNPPATTEVMGVLELATNAEALNGADPRRGIVPSALKYVLDQRFGALAPSGFMKGLLVAATAAVVRTALELKSAALRDTGADNGLDADLLDGQHGAYYRDWNNLTNKPAAFPPSAHTHAALTFGTYLVGDGYNGGTARTVTVDATTMATAGKVVARDGNSDVFARLFRSEYPVTNASIGFIMTQTEVGADKNNYIRPSTPAQVKAAMSILVADVGGLQATLNLKAPLDSPRFTGNVGIGTAGVAPLDVNTGSGRILFRTWDSASSIDSVNAGNNAFAPLNIKATTFTFNDSAIWHAGNFNPVTKANTAHTHDGVDIVSGTVPVARLGFGQSLVENGYCRLPNGLILQWGHYANPVREGANPAVAFPIAFPSACFGVFPVGQNTDADGGRDVVMQVAGTPSKTGFAAVAQWTGSGTTNELGGFYWWAIGN